MKTRISTGLVLLLAALIPSAAMAQTEILDSTGDGTNPLDSAIVAADASGNIYVGGLISDNVFRIQASDTCSVAGMDCVVTEIIDASGDGGGATLTRPSAIASDSMGNIYVVGQTSDNVFRITNPTTCSTGGTGCVIDEIIDSTHLDNPVAIAIDSADNVFVAAATTNAVFRISASTTCSIGGSACSITEVIDSTGDDAGNGMTTPVGLAVDSSRNLYVTTQNSDNAFRIETPDACNTSMGSECTITEIIDATGDGSLALTFGKGIAVDSSGNVFVNEHGFGIDAALFKIETPGTCSTNGTPCTITAVSTRALGNSYNGLAIDAADNVFIAGGNGDDVLRVQTSPACAQPACTVTTIIDSTGDGGGNVLDGPGTVVVVNDTDVYVAGGSSDNVFRISGSAMPVELLSYGVD